VRLPAPEPRARRAPHTPGLLPSSAMARSAVRGRDQNMGDRRSARPVRANSSRSDRSPQNLMYSPVHRSPLAGVPAIVRLVALIHQIYRAARSCRCVCDISGGWP
jgi:hypothetical protein